MTVICTVITMAGTVHATDSFLTKLKANGQRELIETQETKIIPVRAWRGAMSYYGLAQVEGHWSTLDWLRDQAIQAGRFGTAEEFAHALAVALKREIARLPLRRNEDKGIGIHFSAYEWIDDYWMPELFHISNWLDPSYTALRPTGVGASGDMYSSIFGQGLEQGGTPGARRRAVHQAIQSGTLVRYNNGDPMLYNPAANAIQGMFVELNRRRILRNANDIEVLRSLGRRPVEVVSEIQRDFCAPGTRVVGGKVHDLAVTPTGDYSSTSGDI
jgi:hypothetical protein